MAKGEVISTKYRLQYKIGVRESNYIDDIEVDAYSQIRPRARALATASHTNAVRVLAVQTTVFEEYQK